jgi:hypothetical protein
MRLTWLENQPKPATKQVATASVKIAQTRSTARARPRVLTSMRDVCTIPAVTPVSFPSKDTS